MKQHDAHEIERAFQAWLNSTPGTDTLTDSLQRVALINFTLDYLAEKKRRVQNREFTEDERFKIYDKIAKTCGNVRGLIYRICGHWLRDTNGDVVTTNGVSMVLLSGAEQACEKEMVRNGYTGEVEDYVYPNYKTIVNQGCDDCFHTATIYLDHILGLPDVPKKATREAYYVDFQHGETRVRYDLAYLISFVQIAKQLGKKKNIAFNVQFGRERTQSVWKLNESNATFILMPVRIQMRDAEKLVKTFNI